VTDDPLAEPRQLVRLWPDPENGPLRLSLWFGRVDGRPAVVGVEMWGIEPPQGWPLTTDLPDSAIRAEDVRLPLGKMLDGWTELNYRYARASLALWGDLPGHKETVRTFEQRIGSKRVGRPRLSDDFLEKVTATYNAAVREGDRRPALRVQEELGAAVAETARGWIRQARERGFPVAAPKPTGRKR
jgi:hypothetical protein